jgi:GxxExxY protein
MTEDELNHLTERIIGVAIGVHKELGPGLLEKVYQRCLKIALEENGFSVQMELPVGVVFHGQAVADEGFRLDLLVEDIVILEIKSVSLLTPVFAKQLGTYLKLSGKPCGLLMNFNVVRLVDGIKRIRNGSL